MSDKAVIYKQVFRLDAEPGGLVQTFEVPDTAELVAIDWDTRERFGIGLWYRVDTARPSHLTTWRVMVRGTGDLFMAEARHLATVVRDGFAWHLFDADGDHIQRAAS